MTRDNQYVTQKVAHDVGLASERIVTGNQVDTMDDAALAYQAEHGAILPVCLRNRRTGSFSV
jgi:P-type Mg2+ transporter